MYSILKVSTTRAMMFIAMLISFFSASINAAEIVLIFDDLGYRQSDEAVFSLPKEVVVSILPSSPFGQRWAKKANQQGREVMLHLPMEPATEKHLGPIALTSDMYPISIANTFESALSKVPYAIGVNNHMGSKLTAERLPMMALMNAIKHKNLFFIDSRTTPFSVAESIANSKGIPAARRHVFLDHQVSETFIEQQFRLLIRMAKKRGKAIGIAHPHPVTVSTISRLLNNLEYQQTSLIYVSTYFDYDSNKSRQLVKSNNRTLDTLEQASQVAVNVD